MPKRVRATGARITRECVAVSERIVVLGVGYAGLAVMERARRAGLASLGVVRSADRAADLSAKGFAVRCGTVTDGAFLGAFLEAGDHVVVTFPPDGDTDARLAPQLRHVGAVTYLSTSGVYEGHRGPVNDATPLPASPGPRARARLAAEACYRAVGGTVLRCPGIYGPDRGLHVRVVSGAHKIPGDGTRFTSRIHVEDLATLVLASGAVHGETFVVGDQEPAPHGEVVRWICATYGVPMPPHAPLEEVHETLRADRRIDPERALRMLGVTLRFPSFRAGMARIP
jgi:nucleoside-diphosphate-sugar epimerase